VSVPCEIYQNLLTATFRMCPGRFLADNSVFMLITSMLATVAISKPKDSNGVEKPFDPPYILAGLSR
jgi:hypothetical protein